MLYESLSCNSHQNLYDFIYRHVRLYWETTVEFIMGISQKFALEKFSKKKRNILEFILFRMTSDTKSTRLRIFMNF